MKPSEVLDAAANIVIRDGWNQGTYYRTENPEWNEEEAKSAPCCQAGAVNRAALGYAWGPMGAIDQRGLEARDKADSYMREYVSSELGQGSPIAWNDCPTTTADDVIAALRGAAARAREAGE